MPLLGHSQRATHVTDLFFPAGIGMADESRAGTTFHPTGRTCDTLHFLQAVLPTQHCCSLPRESPAPHPEHLHFLTVISLCMVLTKHFCFHLGNSFYLIILTAQLHPPSRGPWMEPVERAGFAPKQAAQPVQCCLPSTGRRPR